MLATVAPAAAALPGKSLGARPVAPHSGDMHVTFPRLPDHDRAYALVERDDGATYRLYGGLAGPRLPHDVRHFVVERELAIPDGIWAGIASGLVFESMRHVSGRRPPHSAERSSELLADFRDRGLRAEALASLVECVARLDRPSEPEILQLAAAKLSVLPGADVDTGAIAAAAMALQVEAARWARLRVGENQLRLAAGGPGGTQVPAAGATARSAH